MTRSFLVLFNDLPIERDSVKKGENGPEVVTAARCVNVGLFLSNSLRRDVDVHLGILEHSQLGIISFPGENLKRVSPDERSISFFLLKAIEVLNGMKEDDVKSMDNGICIQRMALDRFISRWKGDRVFVSIKQDYLDLEDSNGTDGLYIYQIGQEMHPDLLKYSQVGRPRTPERFILDINLRSDLHISL
ncbi:MAG: hypothetical protein ACFFEF_10975 [Candidatus Thorarchaeota archaeon]